MMKLRFSGIVCCLLLLACSSGNAQLLLGPGIQAGMTYSKNFVIEDTSQYFIRNSPSLFAAAGLDVAYQFDKKVRVQLGVQGQYRSFNLKAPSDVTGLSFTNIQQNAIVISVPLSVNYRIPMGSGGNRFFNVMAGHALDFSFDDSTVTKSPLAAIDSGGAFIHHLYQIPKQKFPVTSVLLGIGMDFQSAKGNLFNLSLVWGISTRTLFKGSVQEWEVLHQNYDPTTATADPEEFPDHYYEWALRGSNLSLRASYYFNLTGDKEGKEEKKKDRDEEESESSKGKKEKPAKAPKPDKEPKPEKEKPAKEPKPGKEKKPKKDDEEEEDED